MSDFVVDPGNNNTDPNYRRRKPVAAGGNGYDNGLRDPYDLEDRQGHRKKSRYENRSQKNPEERAKQASEDLKNRRKGNEPERANLDEDTKAISRSTTKMMEILDEQPRLFGLFTTRGGIEARSKAFTKAAQDVNFFRKAVEEPGKLIREHPKLKNNLATNSDKIAKKEDIWHNRLNEGVPMRALRKIMTLNGTIPFGRHPADMNFKFSMFWPANYYHFWMGGTFKTPIGLVNGLFDTRRAILHHNRYGAAAFEEYAKKHRFDFLRKEATHFRSQKELEKAEKRLENKLEAESKLSARNLDKIAKSDIDPRLLQRMADNGNPYARTIHEIRAAGNDMKRADIRASLEKHLKDHVDNPRMALHDAFDEVKSGETIFHEEHETGHKLKDIAGRDFHPEQLRQLEMSNNPYLATLSRAHSQNLNPETIADELHSRLNGESHVNIRDFKHVVDEFDAEFQQSRMVGQQIQQATRNINDSEFINRLEASSNPYLQTSGWAARAQNEAKPINGDEVLRDLSQRLDTQTPLREVDWEKAVSRFEAEYAEARHVADTIRQDAIHISDADTIHRLQQSSNPYHQTIGNVAARNNAGEHISDTEIMRDLDQRLENGARSTARDLRQAADEIKSSAQEGERTGDSGQDGRTEESPRNTVDDRALENSSRAEFDPGQRQPGPITQNRNIAGGNEPNGNRSTGSAAREYDGPVGENDNMRLSHDFPDIGEAPDKAGQNYSSRADIDAAGQSGHIGADPSFLKKAMHSMGPRGEAIMGGLGFLAHTTVGVLSGRGLQKSIAEGGEFGSELIIGVAAFRAAERGDEQAVWSNVSADIGAVMGAALGSGWASVPLSVGGGFAGSYIGGEAYEDHVFFEENRVEGDGVQTMLNIASDSFDHGQAEGVALGHGIMDYIDNPVVNIRQDIQEVRQGLNTFTDTVEHGWNEYGEPASDTVIDAGSWALYEFSASIHYYGTALKDNASEIGDGIADTANDVAGWVDEAWEDPAGTLSETASAGWDGFTSGVSHAWKNRDDIVDTTFDIGSATLSSIGSAADVGLTWGDNAVTWFNNEGIHYANKYYAEPVNNALNSAWGGITDAGTWVWNNPDDLGWGAARAFEYIGHQTANFTGWLGGIFNGAAQGVAGTDEAEKIAQYRGQKHEMVEKLAFKQKEFVNRIQEQSGENTSGSDLRERIREITGKDMPPEQALRNPEVFAKVFDDYVLTGNAEAVQLMTAFAILETKRASDEDMIARVDHYLDQHPELDNRFDFATFAQRMQHSANPEVPEHAKPLLDKIAEGESRGAGGYDAVYGHGDSITHHGGATSPTEMTIQDVLDYQAVNGNPAFGRYQFKPDTLREMVDKNPHINMDTKFTEATQDQLAFELLKEEGYYNYAYGNGSEAELNQFLNEISGRWAAVKDATGEGRYDHMDNNEATIDHEEMKDVLRQARSQAQREIESRTQTRQAKKSDEPEPGVEPTELIT